MNTSLVRSCVLRSRNSDDVTSFLPTGPAWPATSLNDLAWRAPVVSAIVSARPGSKYVRGKFPLFSFAYIWMPCPIWRRLLAHFTRLACSRARLSDGSRILISSAMMPITTSSSTRVKPFALREESFMTKLLSETSRGADPRQADGFGWMRLLPFQRQGYGKGSRAWKKARGRNLIQGWTSVARGPLATDKITPANAAGDGYASLDESHHPPVRRRPRILKEWKTSRTSPPDEGGTDAPSPINNLTLP